MRGKKDCYIGHSGWIIQIDSGTQSLNSIYNVLELNINHLPYVIKAAANNWENEQEIFGYSDVVARQQF